jgi:hypothetical protein
MLISLIKSEHVHFVTFLPSDIKNNTGARMRIVIDIASRAASILLPTPHRAPKLRATSAYTQNYVPVKRPYLQLIL